MPDERGIPHGGLDGGRGRRLERLLTDYFAPGFTVANTPLGYPYARLLARMQGERQVASTRSIRDEIVGPVRGRYLDSRQALFAQVPRERLTEALAPGVSIMAISAVGPRYYRPARDGGPQQEAERVARFAAARFEVLFGPAH